MLLKSSVVTFTLIFLSIELCYAQNQTQELTHYIFPDFVDGVVLMKNGRKNKVAINYNAISEEMIFTKGDLKLAIGSTESELIDTIYIENKKFIRLNGKFVEVLYQSPEVQLFTQYKCRIHPPGNPVGFGGTSETAAVDNYSIVQGDARFLELELPEGYVAKPYLIYFVKTDGVVKEVASMKQLEKLFKKKKDHFRDFVRDQNVKFDDPAKVQSLVSYLDSLS